MNETDNVKNAPEEERAHHPLGPSGLQNVEACPCFQSYQPKVLHERCVAGSRAHKVTEVGEDDLRLSDDDASAAAECMDFFEGRKQLMEEARQRVVNDRVLALTGGSPDAPNPKQAVEEGTPQVRELTELQVRVDNDVLQLPIYDAEARKWNTHTLPCTTSGYFDRALVDYTETYAELFDWKFGMHAVEAAKNNVQGICYALGLMRDYPKLQRVRFWFKQPLIDAVTSAEFTRDEIPHLYLRVKTIVARAVEARHRMMKDDFSLAKSYDPVCTFCAHLGRCPVVAASACTVARKFFPLEIPEDITPTQVMDAKNSSIALRLARVVKTWAEAFKSVITDRVLRGDALPPEGYTLQSRSGNREVVDVKKFRLAALQFVTEAELERATRFTIGDVEEVIKERAPRGQKKAEVDRFKTALEVSNSVKPGQPYSFLRVSSTSTTD